MDELTADNPGLAELGLAKIRWAERHLRLLSRLKEEFGASRPFAGLTIGICLHIEPKTAVLCKVLQAGGAELVLTGSPGTTQDDVVAALRLSTGLSVFGQHDDQAVRHQENLRQVLQHKPHLLLDNGADLVIANLADPQSRVIGGTEETTSGANRLRDLAPGTLTFPVIVINDSPLKLIMENEHGVGPTIVEGFMRATNLLVAARPYVVFGYGSVGRGIARCLRALGGQVTVVEPDRIRALEAALDGMRVCDAEQAFRQGNVFISATGRPGVIRSEHFDLLPNDAILINAGHFSWEIDLDGLRSQAISTDRASELIEIFTMPGGKQIILLARGDMLNLAAGGGNPVETMDLGLALQAQSLRYIAEHHKQLPHEALPVPREINLEVSGAMVDVLTSGLSN